MESQFWTFVTSQPLGIALLLLFIAGLLTKRVVMGWQYTEMRSDLRQQLEEEKERSHQWQTLALRGTGLVEETVRAVATTLRAPP